jgi:NADH:ubiquinone oxidoreductase subunit H
MARQPINDRHVLNTALKILFVLNATLIGVTYMALLERKVIGGSRCVWGRCAQYGILQPIADAVKLILAKTSRPRARSVGLHGRAHHRDGAGVDHVLR